MSHDHEDDRERQLSRDEETIRGWADAHDAVPVSEGGDTSEDRFGLVPEHEVTDRHDELAWDEFHRGMDEGDHVVVYHGEDATDPFEVTGQGTIIEGAEDEEIEQRLMEGETVTSTVTETAVVESVVVEEATVESELADATVVDEQIVDLALLDRTTTDCRLADAESADDREWFDVDRYFESMSGEGSPGEHGGPTANRTEMGSGSVGATTGTEPETGLSGTTGDEPMDTGHSDESMDSEPMGTTPDDEPMDATDDTGAMTSSRDRDTMSGDERMGRSSGLNPSDPDAGEFPYHVELDVEETWSVTRAFTEEYVVESRVTDTEVTEAETVEDYDIDVSGLHRSILKSGILGGDIDAEDAMTHYDAETELAEQDRITTTFTREVTVEDEVLDRTEAIAEVTERHPTGMEFRSSSRLESSSDLSHEEEMSPGASDEEMGTGAAGTTDEGTSAGASGEEMGATGSREDGITIDEEVIGTSVVDPAGDEIGMVSDVDEAANALYVDVEPGITERIQAALGWGDVDDDDYRLGPAEIDRMDDDAVVLRDPEDVDETSQ